jgi:alkanesulfonate monooxygenase SsuD/methylene tetrahydromethanopterin reductase-like flavin-dependent oxidoreductase (luciferase family)
MAARTKRIGLATGAVIIPWNDPVRVVEKITMLDHLSDGRVVFGMGRGLARREYSGFGIDMSESRDRFDEAARMILSGLETGVVEGDGRYYPRARTEIRPRPLRSFRDRIYCIAMSPDSVEAAAKLGAGIAIFSQAPWETAAASMNHYREMFRELHGRTPPPVLTCDFVICDEDQGRAEALARKHIAGYLTTIFEHYELMSDHLKKAKGYQMYGDSVDLLRDIGLEQLCTQYVGVQAYGTPERIVEKLRERAEVVGDFRFNACFRFAGIPFEAAQKSMRLLAERVFPAFR